MSDGANLVLKGTRYYAAGEEVRSGRLKTGSEVCLVHTPNNPHDSNAVAVYLMPSGKPLGHLSRRIAEKYSMLVDRNCIAASSVVSVEESSSAFLRVEIRLRLGQAENASKNDITGTTQIIPAILHAQLRKNRIEARKALIDSLVVCERAVAATKAAMAQAQAALSRSYLSDDEQRTLRVSIDKATAESSRNQWGGSLVGVILGGMAGGSIGALCGGIIGFVGGEKLGDKGGCTGAREKLHQFESCQREYDSALQHYRIAENSLRAVASNLPHAHRHSEVRQYPPGPDQKNPDKSAESQHRWYTREPEGGGPGCAVSVYCEPCGGKVRFLSAEKRSWLLCPGCGFTRRRAGSVRNSVSIL